jgi:prefoldin subunit 5
MADDHKQDLNMVRELATHAADIKHLQEDMNKILKQMESMQATLISISSTLAEARGGWKVLMMVGGASGALGAILVKLFHWYTEGR